MKKAAKGGNQGRNQGGNFDKVVPTSWKANKNNDLDDDCLWISVKEGGNLLGISDRAVKKNCKAGKYTVKMVAGNGGQQYRILLSSLPPDVVKRYLQEKGFVHQPTAMETAIRDQEFRRRSEIANWQRDVAVRRHAIVKDYVTFVSGAATGSLLERKREFCRLYNDRLLSFPEEFYGSVKRISFQTVDRWIRSLDEADGDSFALAPQYGSSKGKTKVSDEEARLLKMSILSPNQSVDQSIRDMMRALEIDGKVPGASEATYERYIANWRQNNHHIWVLMREGIKSLNDKLLPYLERERDSVEVGDVVVADGHTFNFDILSPFTGRPVRMTLVLVYDFRSNMPLGWDIARTENTRSIAAAYYRAIRALKFVPRVFYLDNGRAFRGKFFSKTSDLARTELPGLFERLEPYGYMGTTYAMPYHGQSKTIERFFGIMHEFEKKQSSYRGNSIANKVPRLMRNEKLHQDWHERMTGGTCPTVADVHYRLIDWYKEYSETASGQQSALRGARPIDVYHESVDRVQSQKGFSSRVVTDEEIRFLMMEHQTAALYRNGIRLFGQHYWNEKLFGYERGKKSFVVRYDLMDTSRIWVFDESGKSLICEAQSNVFSKIHPQARLLGNEDDVRRLSEAMDRKQGMKQVTIHQAKEIFRAQEEELKRALPPVEAVKKVEEQQSTARKIAVNGHDEADGGESLLERAWKIQEAQIMAQRERDEREHERYRIKY